jgi:hypothetical protein
LHEKQMAVLGVKDLACKAQETKSSQLTQAFSFSAEMSKETRLPPLILHRLLCVDKDGCIKRGSQDVSLPIMMDRSSRIYQWTKHAVNIFGSSCFSQIA